jgi:hypothetical protein
MKAINNIICPECCNSWDQESRFDVICKNCGQDCSDQSFEENDDFEENAENDTQDF